jgi:hypothetical protein
MSEHPDEDEQASAISERALAYEYLKVRRKPADEPWDVGAVLWAWCAEGEQIAEEIEWIEQCCRNPEEELLKADMNAYDNLTPEERRAQWGDDY